MTDTAKPSRANKIINELVLESDISYVAAIFDNISDAKAAYEQLKVAQRDGIVTIIDAAYAEKTASDGSKVYDHTDWRLGEDGDGTGSSGSIVCGLISIVAGAILLPAALSTLVNTAIASVHGHKTKLTHEYTQEVTNTLPVGTATLVAIVEDEFLVIAEVELHKLGGKKAHNNKIPRSTAASLITAN